MKKLISFLLIINSITVFSQVQQLDRTTLNVTGFARVNVRPDICILRISVSEIEPRMIDAIKELGNKSNYYLNLLKSLGFTEKVIQTSSFSVAKHQVFHFTETIDSGFVASQNIDIQFEYNNNILQKIIEGFSKNEKPIDFNFEFVLSEKLKSQVQTQIIDYAVKDAMEKANSIVKASGLKLIKINNISYGMGDSHYGMELVEKRHQFEEKVAYSIDEFKTFNFTPSDLVFRDVLTINWTVE